MDPETRKATLGLGCWAFGGGYWLDQQRDDSIRTIHAALRGGIRHFDTAQGYGKGLSEQLVGQQLKRFSKEVPREEYCLATKLFLPKSPSEILASVQTSLRRLCTPYVDILYVHWPDSTKDCRPYLQALGRVRAQGLIKHIGVSNFTQPLLQQALEATEISYCQIPLSLLWTRSLRNLAPLCTAHGLRIVAYSPLGLGLLGGRYRSRDDLDAQDLRRRLFPFDTQYVETFHSLLHALEQTALEYATDMATVALAWVLAQPVDTVLTGARTKEQLYANLHGKTIPIAGSHLVALRLIADNLDDLIPPDEDNVFFHRW